MSSSVRYNLRTRASGPHPGAHGGLAPPPGMPLHTRSRSADALSDSGSLSDAPSTNSDSRVRPGVSYSQAARASAGADTGSRSDRAADPRSTVDDSASRSEQSQYPPLPSSPSGTVEDSTVLSPSDKENTTPVQENTREPSTDVEHEEQDAGQWTEVRRQKQRARSHEGLPLRDLPPHLGRAPPRRLNDEQQRAVNATANALTEEQRGRFRTRMRNVAQLGPSTLRA